MSVAVPQLPLSLVVDLINEWGGVPQEVSRRPWNGYPGPDSAVRLAFEAAWPEDAGAVSDAEISAATDRIYPVFTAEWPAGTARALNVLTSELGLAPEMIGCPHGVRRGWSTADALDRLPAALLATLVDHLASSPADTFGICGSGDCADVFVDISPRHNKLFCSPRCQTRERVRAHRRRTG